MADEDKQFEATPQKLKKAREEGQVVKSRDLSTAVFMLGMFMLLFNLAPLIWHEIAGFFIQVFEQVPNATLEKIGWQYLAILTLKALLILILPFLIVAVLIAVITDMAQVGPLIATKAIEPKFDKLNPVKGFKNIFSQRTLVELIKNIIKILVLGYVAYLVFKDFLPQLLLLGGTENIFAMLGVLGAMLFKFIMMAGITFVVIAGADYLYQRFKFLKDQKMSFKEIKDEYKNSEGDPHVKAALRQRRMQMLQQSMLDAVPTADVITTNPIHVAVALKYNADTMQAPTVVAKGTELFAERIKDIARNHNIPIVENPTVARALFKLVDIDHEIPADLYQAVAEILMFAWRSQGKTPPTPKQPVAPPSTGNDSATP
jgi:flagellar biosynthetic protein FlhB